MSFRVKAGVVLLIVFNVGLGGGYALGNAFQEALEHSFSSALAPIQSKETANRLVHPLLAYRTPEATVYGEYVDLKQALEVNVAEAKNVLNASKISLYFRDLDIARWVGIAEDDTYHPASLMKVPLMIAYFKEAEKNPALLSKRLPYHTFTNLPPFDTPSTLVVGTAYSVNNLIERMIIDSDNGAAILLLEHMNPEVLSETYTTLGIPEPDDYTIDYKISARTYGLFFRILYNATYLTPAYSEKALALLTKTTFTKTLVAGVPEGVTVAHKWGQHVSTRGEQITGIELSDCGVVYYPGHPYLLCVMTRATDEASAMKIISAISKTTYDAVAKQYATAK